MKSLSKSAFAFCLFSLCLGLAACCKCGNEQSAQVPATEEEKTNIAAPNETEGTEFSTDAPVEPTEIPDGYEPEYDGRYTLYTSYERWLEKTAHAILENRFSDIEYEKGSMSGVVFVGEEPVGTAAPEFVNAYSACASLYPDSEDGLKTVYFDPVLHIPYETAVNAENRLNDMIEEFTVMQTSWRNKKIFYENEGFCGENWFILQSDRLLNMTQRIHTIWRRDDSGNWYEFGNNNEELAMIVSANIVSEKTGFLCSLTYADIQPTEYGDRVPERFFATFDGGETWQDMELYPPRDEFEDYYSFSFSGPVFEGDRGVLLIDISDRETVDGVEHKVEHGCFITEDGGHTWEFMRIH